MGLLDVSLNLSLTSNTGKFGYDYDKKHFNELVDDSKQKMGAKANSMVLRNICQILANDKTSTVDNVVDLYDKTLSKLGQAQTTDFLSRLLNALGNMSDNKNIVVTSEDYEKLLEEYIKCSSSGVAGKLEFANTVKNYFSEKNGNIESEQQKMPSNREGRLVFDADNLPDNIDKDMIMADVNKYLLGLGNAITIKGFLPNLNKDINAEVLDLDKDITVEGVLPDLDKKIDTELLDL